MLEREDVRRPAQVNACFEGGSSRTADIVAALHETGLTDNQITVIDRPDPDDTKIATEEASFFERLKGMFGGGGEKNEGEQHYDLLILAHLGQDASLAGPVQEVFQRFDASRVNYYPPAEADMRVLGEADAQAGTKLTPVTDDDADTTTSTTRAAPARPTDVRVEPGEVAPTRTYLSGEPGEPVERQETVVYRTEPGVVIEESTPPATGRDTTGKGDARP